MKQLHIAFAIFGVALLSSCVQENSIEVDNIGENEMVFVMGSNSTRSVENVCMATKGVSIPMGKTDAGEPIFLEETIEELNPSPATKGAPVYTANVGKVYETMGVFALPEKFGDLLFEVKDDELIYNHDKDNPDKGLGWRYVHLFNGSPWPGEEIPVDFYLRMPQMGSGMRDLVLPTQAGGSISFNYRSPVSDDTAVPQDAFVQEDILFGNTTLTKKQHDHYLPNGAPVMMYHALSAVKFRNGHANSSDTKTIIKRVVIRGLKDDGHCVVTSSNGVTSFTWSEVKRINGEFAQEFSNPTYNTDLKERNPDGSVNFTDSRTELYLPNTSWTSAAADHNLNNGKGELTFWFVPQDITDEVVLEVTFLVKTPYSPNGTEITHSIQFGQTLNDNYTKEGEGNVKWKAGQLRTYTLRPYDVDVDIEDTMQNLVKSDVRIANTGNVPEYVRVLLLGNWYGWNNNDEWNEWKAARTDAEKAEHEPSILVGYDSDGTDGRNVMIDPWFRGGYDRDADGTYVDPYGFFDSTFTLGEPRGNNKWIDASGGFYYPDPIGPGVQLNSETDALFQQYTLTSIPDIYIAVPTSNVRVKAAGVHLVMTVAVQAIGALDEDGNEKGWLEAWYEATKNKKLDPTDPKNAAYVHVTNSGSGSGSGAGE